MPDITAPTFSLTVTLTTGSTSDTHTWVDATDYVGAGEVATDYYTKLFTYIESSTASTSLANTANNANDNQITQWTSTPATDSWYRSYMVIALLYGQEAVVGTFAKGDITYYSSEFYLATDAITGSTDPSSGTGNDADFVALTTLTADYLSYINYYTTANDVVTEAIKTATHAQRKLMLTNEEHKCNCDENETVLLLDNYLQAITTEVSLNNYMGAQKNVEEATDIVANLD